MAEPDDADFDSAAAELTSNMFMVAAIVFLFLVLVFVFFLYLYAKRHLRRARILVFSSASDLGASSSLFRGLDASVLRSLPVAVYRAAESGNGIECAVCLSELADGEAVRILSKCGHGFHLECIDMWFHSHSTCPLCRSPVGAEPIPVPNSNSLAGSETLNPDSPVLQSNQRQTSEAPSSSSARLKKPKGDLAIEIPRREPEGFSSPVSPLPTSRNADEETRTPGSGRLRAVRRRLSMGKRTPTPGSGSACSPMGGDLEQGFGGFYGEGSAPPATPPANSRLEITKSHKLPEASV
ncbi:RING-H2 finger protein ATL2-like [Zingiber officinale]|uniref:RING-type E3 ubiquitin transferase n=1 Tax=Zingiber officinale TaxID=94328 RepID=A0A8J5FW11_ZINOF|nr:RING-H2 finger protein ATL2-like [Zingiber officinale]XP_042403021.1 RING-H2 finger protein ATL2-like [Zingiber officinale]XP_042403022.1 RING-H2 finger protein ATL2-like [Zingiber officinale]XP_042403023.1 RING-H2 finger protein ATL2-like [Zingiber officinale]XP_042403024.1 RING-H2 finger protein ATL2-like [Zingiber officinale]XP_042403025.1 RING-H2 finger protein ATL2-like [Zingiber officinale]XP_042403026.1 RING-H2 finger protein ATL2-like [Zingiber officinale]XP_042403027.1 RING-H2 fi